MTKSSTIEVRRLGRADVPLARHALALIADVFEEPTDALSDAYLASLLMRPEFWLVVAIQNGAPIGGVTAHVLPMTRSESTELFIYDLAVHPLHQRRGVGRSLIEKLRAEAAADSIGVAFVPADNDDEHALAFYRSLGASASPVTIFTFDEGQSDIARDALTV